ncbi:DUF1501 domain-containing protein [Iamia sp. SCSIO 61187]|uniref:DUF1501 domain-containing protein n=1 Tax=Iamia sp. SCSIO 61187 TaxID=2722752 RepID=UPI001C627FC5|nr:DUF1501 domain-containing protein [Iamia sp. SCSIO 61187]QYG92155.1 DUF1501 domain-containing protein [Iamia sp. SCSIO 61187]
MPDLEYEEIQELLSLPADAIPGQVARRRFLQGALAAAAGTALLPSWMDRMAAAATPIAATDGVLVVLQLGGGNDGMSMVVPTSDHPDHGRYRTARGNLAVTAPLTLGDGLGLNPRLPKLKARYDAGQVAVVRGVGQTTSDFSHFSSTATWMAGTAGSSRATGWLGRWLDGVPESAGGLRALQVGPSVPLHMRGRTSVVTAMDTGGSIYGADQREAWQKPVYDAIAAMGAGTTGRGRLADLVADVGADAMALATRLAPVYSPTLPSGPLRPDLTLAARLINADLGLRVLSCSHGPYDLHDGMGWGYPNLLAQLDDSIDAFFQALAPAVRDQVTLMTFSEFGRTVRTNGSGGTDHGTAAPQLVIGGNVKGGLYGAQPRLDDLTRGGDLKVHVDLRSYYASVIDGWLAGGSSTVLGATYEDLRLFRATPGGPSTPPPTTPNPWRPFPDAATLVRQQYLDLLGRVGEADGVAFWTGQLTSGARSIPWLVNAFLNSAEFGRAVSPAARLALICSGTVPAFDDLMAWGARVRAGEPLAAIAVDVCSRPAFAARYGALSDGAFVDRAHSDATGAAPASAFRSTWVGRLGAGTATRADVMAALTALPAAVSAMRPTVDVTMTYAGLLRRAAEPEGLAFWVAKVTSGTSIQRLVSMFFASAEYQRRFS